MENEPFIIFFVFTLALLLFYLLVKPNKNVKQKIIVQQDYLAYPDFSPPPVKQNELEPDNEDWILKLEAAAQLSLALKLAAVAQPVWQQYIKQNTVAYMESLSKKRMVIPEMFLETALQTIKDNSSVVLSVGGLKYDDIKTKLDQFTYPMAALHDGDLVLPQSIKKIFTGVYNILKGMEQTNNQLFGHFLLMAITDLIHSIELNQLLSLKEINLLLHGYKK